MKIETRCIHAGYDPANGEPCQVPIVQSTTFRYKTADEVAKLFDLATAGFFYSRIGNPTVDAVERKIASLEGGAAALCASSGQAALLLAFLNIAKCGDHILSATNIYGGTFNILNTLMKRFGIETTFVDQDADNAALEKEIRPNTRFIFGETLANPALSVLDIDRFAALAHKHGIPLLVDNTFPTPILCQPIAHGADIVIHSTTKYMDGQAVQLGGAIVDSGKFDWKNGKFPEFTEPDESYHGLIYTDAFGDLAYIVKARAQLMRDMGCCQSAQGAFYTNLGLDTLPVRMRQHCANARKVAEWLSGQSDVLSVNYPGLAQDKYHALALKYLPDGASGVVSFTINGGRAKAASFINSLKLITLETHVADIRTCALHPASSTHRQLSDSRLADAGINPGLVRISTGLENIDDIIADLDQAMRSATEK